MLPINSAILNQNPAEFFKENFEEVFEERKLKISEESTFYLISLMVNACNTEKFYKTKSEDLGKKPLTFLLRDALEGDSFIKYDKLRKIGDFSLVFSGFFQEYLTRKERTNLLDFYTSLGEVSYNSLSELVRDNSLRPLFRELSKNFVGLRNSLRIINIRSRIHNEKGLFKLFSEWYTTGEEILGQELKKKGIKLTLQ
ncbi:hypothetical protein K9L16_02110 [Candidatus Pacearchaeota archaeon]|nr:hypothetical protein [Candidatus Pacearchaeota archaeon]